MDFDSLYTQICFYVEIFFLNYLLPLSLSCILTISRPEVGAIKLISELIGFQQKWENLKCLH